MPASKPRRLILGPLIVSICCLSVFGLRFFSLRDPRTEVSGTQATPSPSQPPSQTSSANSQASEPTLIFAGLSGQSPRYIESGPDKGLGYLDQDSREIRKGLIQDGFHVVQEWMTPARIAHEFRKKTPICIYPTEWSRPKELFSRPQDRIYSIALNLGGNENRFIWVKKTDLPRFKKHLDPKGSVQMNSLIEDGELKTLLVRDKDYGELGRIVTEVDAQGDQVVREKFKKHIGVLLVNDSRQMVEMLNANRFDYILSDEIEDQNWADAKVDASQFVRINFSSTSVKGVDDPNLVFHSVSCSSHPLSIRAMPYINKWIAYSRGIPWLEKSSLRRAQRQKSQSAGGIAWAGSVVNQFRGQFENGNLDRWYGLQQKQVPSLKLFPDELNQAEVELPNASPKSGGGGIASLLKRPLWHSKFLLGNKLIVWNDSSGLSIPSPGNYVARIEAHQVFRGISALELLSGSELDLIETQSASGASSLSNLLAVEPVRAHEVEKLTLFAKGLSVLDASGNPSSDLSSILPILRKGSLKELTIFGANPEMSNWLVENLPQDLRVLNCISCALSQTEIHLTLAAPSLRELRLDNSQIQAWQLKPLLKSLSGKLEVLSLGHSRTLWTQQLAQEFGSVLWPKLRELNLEQSYLSDEEFLAIQTGLPQTLEILRLGNTCLSMRSLGILFRMPFLRLQELDLSGSDLNHVDRPGTETLKFPPHLRRLDLAGMSLTAKQARSLTLPSSLEILDLQDNPLNDDGLVPLLSQLTSSIETLNLSKTGVGARSLQLLSQRKYSALRSLDLNWNLIGDPGLEALKGAGVKLLRLGLGHTGLTKRGLALLGEVWAKEVLSLDLSGNSFRSGDLGLLYPRLNPNLRELNLSSNSELDVPILARFVPNQLKNIDLSDAQLSNSEIKALAPQLPKGLRVLNFSRSGFDEDGAMLLAHSLPQHLEELNLEAVPLGRGLGNLVNSVPASLRILRIGGNIGTRYSSSQIQTLASALPQGLEDLWLVRFQTQGGFCDLLGSLPPALTRLRIYNVDLDQGALESLNRSWPSSLREVYFEGTYGSKGQMDLSRVPHTIERFVFLGAGFDSKALDAIPANRLQNFHIFQATEASWTIRGIQELFRKAQQIRLIYIVHPAGIPSLDLLQLKKAELATLRGFAIEQAPVGNRSLKHLLSILPSQMNALSLASVGLSVEGIDAIARLLPRSLRDFYTAGNPIGQKGLEVLRRELARREAAGEPLFQLRE